MKKLYDADPQKFRDRQREWKRKNPGRAREIAAKTNRKNWLRIKDYNLRRWYGITLEEYKALFAAQGGVCGICKKVPDELYLHVDHDHKTKHVRGLLCSKCNRGIGYFNDSPEVLRYAAAYLEVAKELGGIAPVVEIAGAK